MSRGSSAAQGAIGGAAAGSAFGPWGTAIGGALGGTLGFLTGGTPDAPDYSEIDLARDNPELYRRIKENDALIRQAQQLYDQRRMGETEAEKFQHQQTMSQLAEQRYVSGNVPACWNAESFA
jgi:phage tail tape-measure protein